MRRRARSKATDASNLVNWSAKTKILRDELGGLRPEDSAMLTLAYGAIVCTRCTSSTVSGVWENFAVSIQDNIPSMTRSLLRVSVTKSCFH